MLWEGFIQRSDVGGPIAGLDADAAGVGRDSLGKAVSQHLLWGPSLLTNI